MKAAPKIKMAKATKSSHNRVPGRAPTASSNFLPGSKRRPVLPEVRTTCKAKRHAKMPKTPTSTIKIIAQARSMRGRRSDSGK